MRSEEQIAREAEQARQAAENRVLARVLGQLQRELDAALMRRPLTPAFDLFWQLKGGVSPLGLAAGLRGKAAP